MSRRAQENLICGVFLFFFVGIIVLSLDYSPRSRLVPLAIAWLGAALVSFQIVWQNLRPADELHVDMLEFLTKQRRTSGAQTDAGQPSSVEPTAEKQPNWKQEIFAFAMIALFLGLFLLFGPILSIFLFCGGYFLISRHFNLFKAFVYSAGFTVTVYFVFVEGLQLQLYNGILEPIITKL